MVHGFTSRRLTEGIRSWLRYRSPAERHRLSQPPSPTLAFRISLPLIPNSCREVSQAPTRKGNYGLSPSPPGLHAVCLILSVISPSGREMVADSLLAKVLTFTWSTGTAPMLGS